MICQCSFFLHPSPPPFPCWVFLANSRVGTFIIIRSCNLDVLSRQEQEIYYDTCPYVCHTSFSIFSHFLSFRFFFCFFVSSILFVVLTYFFFVKVAIELCFLGLRLFFLFFFFFCICCCKHFPEYAKKFCTSWPGVCVSLKYLCH